MPETYEPDRQFVEKLEWQLASEFRRANSLRSRGRIAVPRGVVVLAIVAGVLLTGVAATKAADLIKDSWLKKIELAKAETDVKLQKAFAEFKIQQTAKAEDRWALGLITQEEYQTIKVVAKRSALDLQKSQLNLEEVEASGQAPRNELCAPVVGGHDFVGERLMIEKEILELGLERFRTRLEQLKRRVEVGLVPRHSLDDLQAATAVRETEIEKAQERIDLRKQFVAGALSAKEVEIRDRMALAERDLGEAQSRVDSLQKQLKRAQDLESLGMAAGPSDPSVEGLLLALNAAQEELALASLEIEILKGIK